EIPYFIAIAYSREAGKAMEAKTGEADKLADNAAKVMQEAIAASPDSAALHYRAALIAANKPVPPGDQAKADARREAVRVEATKPSELAKPADPDYLDINVLAASFMKEDDAEKVLREVLQNHPSALPARMRLAELVGQRSDRRDEAIKLLESAPGPSAEDRVG